MMRGKDLLITLVMFYVRGKSLGSIKHEGSNADAVAAILSSTASSSTLSGTFVTKSIPEDMSQYLRSVEVTLDAVLEGGQRYKVRVNDNQEPDYVNCEKKVIHDTTQLLTEGISQCCYVRQGSGLNAIKETFTATGLTLDEEDRFLLCYTNPKRMSDREGPMMRLYLKARIYGKVINWGTPIDLYPIHNDDSTRLASGPPYQPPPYQPPPYQPPPYQPPPYQPPPYQPPPYQPPPYQPPPYQPPPYQPPPYQPPPYQPPPYQPPPYQPPPYQPPPYQPPPYQPPPYQPPPYQPPPYQPPIHQASPHQASPHQASPHQASPHQASRSRPSPYQVPLRNSVSMGIEDGNYASLYQNGLMLTASFVTDNHGQQRCTICMSNGVITRTVWDDLPLVLTFHHEGMRVFKFSSEDSSFTVDQPDGDAALFINISGTRFVLHSI